MRLIVRHLLTACSALALCFSAAQLSGSQIDSAFLDAIAARETKAALECLDKGADIEARTADGWTALIVAIRNRSPEVARQLIARGADVNARSSSAIGSTVIHFATDLDDPSFLEFLIQKGANVNSRSRKGDTPLYSAVSNGKFHAAQCLCQHGADVNAVYRDEDGRTYSMFFAAALANNTNLLHLFCPNRDKIDKRNNRGSTALMETAKIDAPDSLRYLIANGADVNATGPRGHTALIYAAYNGRTENIKLLLAVGADPWAGATDSDDPDDPVGRYDAAYLATDRGHSNAAQLLREAKAKKPRIPDPFGPP